MPMGLAVDEVWRITQRWREHEEASPSARRFNAMRSNSVVTPKTWDSNMSILKVLGLTIVFLVPACAGPGLQANEPMGKQLERALKQIEEQCRASGAPPFGPNKPGQFETACLMFTLKPWEPGDTPESAFAHSIRLPPPHDKPKDIYRAGMSSEQYFQALCKEDAGEWIFRRVEGVNGLRQERPKVRFSLGYVGIAYSTIEQAYYMDSDLQEYFVAPPVGRYTYLETRNWTTPSPNMQGGYTKYFREPGSTRIESKVTPQAEANHALIWRGVRRPHDRENAIDGYEIIIYQVRPFEVLAFRRGFGYPWMGSQQ